MRIPSFNLITLGIFMYPRNDSSIVEVEFVSSDIKRD